MVLGVLRRGAGGISAALRNDYLIGVRTGIVWSRALLVVALCCRSKGRGCHCIGWLVGVDELPAHGMKIVVDVRRSIALKCVNGMVIGGGRSKGRWR